MENTVTTVGIVVMLAGMLVYFGIFDRIGPIETPRGMRRLAYALFAIGFVTILTQSTPT